LNILRLINTSNHYGKNVLSLFLVVFPVSHDLQQENEENIRRMMIDK